MALDAFKQRYPDWPTLANRTGQERESIKREFQALLRAAGRPQPAVSKRAVEVLTALESVMELEQDYLTEGQKDTVLSIVEEHLQASEEASKQLLQGSLKEHEKTVQKAQRAQEKALEKVRTDSVKAVAELLKTVKSESKSIRTDSKRAIEDVKKTIPKEAPKMRQDAIASANAQILEMVKKELEEFKKKIKIIQEPFSMSMPQPISDEAYGASWNGITDMGASKNALYDKINAIGGGGGSAFKTITGITNDVVADAAEDTLTLASTDNKLTIVGTAATDTITFTVDQSNIDHDQLSNFTATEHFTMIDDDTFATAASTTAASSESIKAYVDDNAGSGTPHYKETIKNPSWGTDFFSNQANANAPLYGYAITSGTTNSPTPADVTSINYGTCRLRSSASNNSGYNWRGIAGAQMELGPGYGFDCIIYWDTTTNNITYVGYHDSSSATNPTDGMYFEVSGTTATGYCSEAGSDTATGTTYTISATTWYHLRGYLDAAGTTAYFKIYDMAGTELFSDTVGGDIPDASDMLSPMFLIVNTNPGSATDLCHLDLLNFWCNEDIARGYTS